MGKRPEAFKTFKKEPKAQCLLHLCCLKILLLRRHYVLEAKTSAETLVQAILSPRAPFEIRTRIEMALSLLDNDCLGYVLSYLKHNQVLSLFLCGEAIFNAKLSRNLSYFEYYWPTHENSSFIPISSVFASARSLYGSLKSFVFKIATHSSPAPYQGAVQWSRLPKTLTELTWGFNGYMGDLDLSSRFPHLTSLQTCRLDREIDALWFPATLQTLIIDNLTRDSSSLLSVLPPHLTHLAIHACQSLPSGPALEVPEENFKELPLVHLRLPAGTVLSSWSLLPKSLTYLHGSFIDSSHPPLKLAPPQGGWKLSFPLLRSLGIDFDSLRESEEYAISHGSFFPHDLPTALVELRILSRGRNCSDALQLLFARRYGAQLRTFSGLEYPQPIVTKYFPNLDRINLPFWLPMSLLLSLDSSPNLIKAATTPNIRDYGFPPQREHNARELQTMIDSVLQMRFLTSLSTSAPFPAEAIGNLPPTLKSLHLQVYMSKETAFRVSSWPVNLTYLTLTLDSMEHFQPTATITWPLDFNCLPKSLKSLTIETVDYGDAPLEDCSNARFTGSLAHLNQLETLTIEGSGPSELHLFKHPTDLPSSLVALTRNNNLGFPNELVLNAEHCAGVPHHFANLLCLHLCQKPHPSYDLPLESLGMLPPTLRDLIFQCCPKSMAWNASVIQSLPPSLVILDMSQALAIPFESGDYSCLDLLPRSLRQLMIESAEPYVTSPDHLRLFLPPHISVDLPVISPGVIEARAREQEAWREQRAETFYARLPPAPMFNLNSGKTY